MTISKSDNILTIGHSLVGQQIPDMMNSMGHSGDTDYQVVIGSPLSRNWSDSHRDYVQGVNSREALTTGRYDAVIMTEAVPLETNVRWNDTSGNALNFLRLAHQHNPDVQTYVYETWNGFDVYNGNLSAWRNSLDTLSNVWEGVVDQVNAARPAGSKEMLIIPAGQAMATLYDAIAEGRVPGVTSIRQFFTDDIHPTNAGYYYVTMVHQATLYGESPAGLPTQVKGQYGDFYPGINANVAAVLQTLAWETVNAYDRDGVNDGAPSIPIPPPVVPEEPDVDPVPPAVSEIRGDGASNNLIGTSGNDKMFGYAGHDVLDGRGGADEMHGGTGNDTYWVDNAGDRTIELTDQGRDAVHSTRDWVLGANIEDLYLRDAANSRGEGNSLNNLISGNSGNNGLLGMAGNDTILGNEGNDTLVGGTGNDTLTGGTGRDAFRFTSGDGRDVITDFDTRGGEFLDIRGYANVTALISENGGTRIVLGAHDSIFLQGVDRATLTPANFLFNGTVPKDLMGTQPPVVTPPAVSEIRGDGASNNLLGTSGNDKMFGYAGHDVLDGRGGADEMRGGMGNDTYWVDNTGDRVIEFAGQGTDLVNASISTTLTDNVENLTLRNGANINGTGNALNNVITGNGGNNVLSGAAGNDVLFGGSGNDVLFGGTGSDTLTGGAGRDTFRFGAGDGRDVVKDFSALAGEVLDIRNHANFLELRSENGGTTVVLSSTDSIFLEGVARSSLTTANFLFNGEAPRNLVGAANPAPTQPPVVNEDTLPAGAPKNSIVGTARDEYIKGTNGHDTMFSFAGKDMMNGGTGNDTMYGGSGNDTLNAGVGNDAVYGGSGNDYLNGGDGNDLIFGGMGNDVLNGGNGNDTLRGEAGADVFNGAAGTDIMYAGKDTARDVFVFSNPSHAQVGASRDVVHDFVSRTDVFDLRNMDANTRVGGNQDLVFSGSTAAANSVWAVRSGSDMVVRGDVNGDKVADFEIRVVDISSLVAQDFLF